MATHQPQDKGEIRVEGMSVSQIKQAVLRETGTVLF